MQILIGDIGNTLTKLCLVDETSELIKEYNIEKETLRQRISFVDPETGDAVNGNNTGTVILKILKPTSTRRATGGKCY